MKQEMDDMKNKMLEMEKKVKKLELKVCGFPDAIEVSSEARAAEDWSTRLGNYDLLSTGRLTRSIGFSVQV